MKDTELWECDDYISQERYRVPILLGGAVVDFECEGCSSSGDQPDVVQVVIFHGWVLSIVQWERRGSGTGRTLHKRTAWGGTRLWDR